MEVINNHCVSDLSIRVERDQSKTTEGVTYLKLGKIVCRKAVIQMIRLTFMIQYHAHIILYHDTLTSEELSRSQVQIGGSLVYRC